MKIKKTRVAGGVIYSKGDNDEFKILLIQRAEKDAWPRFWETPRGGVNPEESILQGLKREVKEESGLDIVPIKYIDKFTYTADEGRRISTQYNFLCKMKDPNQKIKLSFEHQDYKYITTPGEAELLVLPEMKKTIKKAFEMLDSDKTISTNPEYELTKPDIIEEYLNQLQEKNINIIEGSLLAGMGLTMIMSLATIAVIYGPKFYNALKNNPERKLLIRNCGKYSGKEKRKCILKTKIMMMKKYLSELPTYRANCPKQKRPEQCYKVLERHEKKVKIKIIEFENKIKTL